TMKCSLSTSRPRNPTISICPILRYRFADVVPSVGDCADDTGGGVPLSVSFTGLVAGLVFSGDVSQPTSSATAAMLCTINLRKARRESMAEEIKLASS
ncbi:MAG: hypothetical protein JSW47_18440, partial [Phycisphaerales bacterium]